MALSGRKEPGVGADTRDGARFVRVLGARIDCVNLDRLMSFVRASVRQQARVSIMYVNAHCMNVRRHDPTYRGILEAADLVYCDGTGVRLAARLRGIPIPTRMTGADWIHDLCRLAVRDGLSVFLVGSEAGVAADAALALKTRHPGLTIAGTAPGYGAGPETIATINNAAPDIVLVGMGTPTQEKWISRHRDELCVPVVWAVGALFEFVSGRIPRGPQWMTQHGLEWACRLAAEPRKLWRRYLIGNPWFFWRVITGADS